ncbi:MAG TPA: PAS domain S-box protein, partial [Candidatus Thermoplasmatota archaeon]|nr:PAS domain S-box protein [Candidatus Thermoplasmatota archaeon]
MTSSDGGGSASEPARVTDRVQALLQALSDADEGIVEARGPRLVFVNDAFCRIVGRTREALLAMPSWREIIAPAEREAIATRLARRLRGDPVENRYESALQRADGGIVPIEVSIQIMEREPELHVLALVRDITERRAAQLEIQERNEQFRALVEAAPDIIARFDRDLRHVYVNPAVERASGAPASAFIGKTNLELGQP